MFKDYYQILGISPVASKQEIKQAYRMMSLKWHPDKNPGVDVTSIMQDINEAYKILNDDPSRARYNKEYREFNKQREFYQTSIQTTESFSWNYNYDVHDEDLKNDINNARAYAKNLVEEFLKSLKETSKVAAKGAWEGAKGYVYAAIILFILGLCVRACMET
jgi:curved DNA-binding protein CbpA